MIKFSFVKARTLGDEARLYTLNSCIHSYLLCARQNVKQGGTDQRTKRSIFPPGSDWGQDGQGLRWRQACLVSAEWDLGALGAEGGT